MPMKHNETRIVLRKWELLKNGRKAPMRSAVELRMFAKQLPYLCVFEKAGPDAEIRLAGTGVCELFDRELKGKSFGDLWNKGAQMSVHSAIARALTQSQAVHVEALGETAQGDVIALEVLLLPLADRRGQLTQLLAYVQPIDPLSKLFGRPIAKLRFLGMSEAFHDASTPDEPAPDSPDRARPPLRLVVSRLAAVDQSRARAATRSDVALSLVS